GTHGFKTPEQWEGSADLDSRVDIFSTAVTIYQARTLGLPFGKQRLMAADRLPTPPSARQPFLPKTFDTVILKALSPDAEQRYHSAEELFADWQRARRGEQPKARLPRARRRYRGAALLVLSMLVCALISVAATRWHGARS